MNSFVNQNQNQNQYQMGDCLICDVDEELVWAQKKQMKLETLGYDIGAIIQCSEALHKKYK